MVHVAPPPGWTSVAVPVAEPPAAGPPPLDRVTADPLALDLEPSEASLLGAISRHIRLVWAVALAATLAVVWWLCWLFIPMSEPESVGGETEPPAAATAEATGEQPTSPEPQSGGVDAPPRTPPTTPSTEPPTTPATPPSVAKEAKPDPPTVAKEAAKNPVKEEKKEVKQEIKQEVKQEAKQVEVKKSLPAQVDVAARMADPLPGIELTDVPLVRAVDLLAAVSTLPITLDADAMRLLGVAPRDRISLRLESATIGQALQAVASQRRLAVTVDNGQVIVTAPAEYRETLRVVPYSVSDLTGADKTGEAEFTALVRMLVAPESWQDVGGRGSIKLDRGTLVVAQTGDVHQQVLVFCEKLRNARKKPLRSRDDKPERFTLTTRTSQARQLLDRPATVNFHEPAPLARILGFLAEATGSDILIDRAAMARAETSDRVETSLTVQKQPLGAALADLLRPLGLTYRAVGPNAIQVTTTEAAEERLELEFYPVARQLSGGTSATKLIERLKTEVAASTWTDAGGLGEVHFDAPSQCLIVLQSQPVQAAVERMLGAKGEGGGGKGE